MLDLPLLNEFRIEEGREGIIHLIFDMPGRSMNVFSNSAIDDIGRFAVWLRRSSVRGCVVRSDKASAFCAGADLPEIEAAFDGLTAIPAERRIQATFDHFFRLSRGLRALEQSGKPVAAAIRGLALGGGCELALACHYRVIADEPGTAIGLPESLVGLLPGAGGTQRMPRLTGIEVSLPVLLDGVRLDGEKAVAAGLAHEAVAPGQEVDAAERWILGNPAPRQPWDRAGWKQLTPEETSALLSSHRTQRFAQTLGHYPAITAILDCLEQGVALPMDAALQREMAIFSRLVQRPEPRAMIRALFIGRLDYDRRRKQGALPNKLSVVLDDALSGLNARIEAARNDDVPEQTIQAALILAGFETSAQTLPHTVARGTSEAGYWFERPLTSPSERLAADFLLSSAAAVSTHLSGLSESDERAINYAACVKASYPSYAGGPLALARYLQTHPVGFASYKQTTSQ